MVEQIVIMVYDVCHNNKCTDMVQDSVRNPGSVDSEREGFRHLPSYTCCYVIGNK